MDPALWLIDSLVVWSLAARDTDLADGQKYTDQIEMEAMLVCSVLLASWGWACWFVLFIGSAPVTDSQLPSSDG